MIHIKCPKCSAKFRRSKKFNHIIKKAGFYKRKSDRKSIQRYYCRQCRCGFSCATFARCYNQKKRHINSLTERLLSAAVSLRESARILKVNRKTVVRKLIFIGTQAALDLSTFNKRLPKATAITYDDLETFEHTKCKPVSVGLMVEEGTRRVLGFNVAKMPAKGLLAKISVKKYGKRIDERNQKRAELFRETKSFVHDQAIIKSDECPYYLNHIKKYFPNACHQTFKGRASAIVGQGELKKVGFDPLFSINHTCATFRYRASRLVRRTWNTTKQVERLRLHLAIIALHHNRNLKTLLPLLDAR